MRSTSRSTSQRRHAAGSSTLAHRIASAAAGLSDTAALRQEFRVWRASLPTALERDTLLWPEVIAESVCAEVAQFLDEEIPERYVTWLASKAERCYAGRRRFYKRMRGRGNAPRDWLYVFMRHWLASLLHLERPDLYRCLPVEFGNGRRLPHGQHPRINRRGFIRDLLPHPRPWNAARVTRHFRWAWLASVGETARRNISLAGRNC